MHSRLIDILGYFGAILATSLTTVFSSLDFAAKWIGVIGGISLAILAIIHKLLQISNETLKKTTLKEQLLKDVKRIQKEASVLEDDINKIQTKKDEKN